LVFNVKIALLADPLNQRKATPRFFVYTVEGMPWQEFEAETTTDLIEYMRMTDANDLSAADDAFVAFILRFREFVQKLCRTLAANYRYDSAVGDAVAEETFRKFRAAETFSISNCKSSNIEVCVKQYLSRTAKHAFIDMYRAANDGNPFTGEEEPVYDLPKIDELDIEPERLAILKKKQEVLQEILYTRLSEKHRIIYLTYKQYELDRVRESEDGTPRKYNLPRKLTKRLREELELVQSTIRKYYEEANNIIEPLLKLYGNK